MAGKQKLHTPACKAQVALADYEGDRTVNNFCWPVRILRTADGEGQTSAMVAKLTDHV
jgi:hypothetical protein